MKKIVLLVVCLLLCTGAAFADLELHIVDTAAVEDYDGVWFPVASSDPGAVIDSLVVIDHDSVLLVIMGSYFTDIPYIFYEGAVFAVLEVENEEPIYLTFQLLNNGSVLYKKYFEGKIVSEIVCEKLKGNK